MISDSLDSARAEMSDSSSVVQMRDVWQTPQLMALSQPDRILVINPSFQ